MIAVVLVSIKFASPSLGWKRYCATPVGTAVATDLEVNPHDWKFIYAALLPCAVVLILRRLESLAVYF